MLSLSKNYFLVGNDRIRFTKKRLWIFSKKIMHIQNEAIHDGCVVTFTGGYEKITVDNQIKRVDVDGGIPHNLSNNGV